MFFVSGNVLTAASTWPTQAEDLATEVKAGIDEWGVVMHSTGVKIFAMEVDGFGNFFFGDDANVPSLLALPFYGYIDASDPLYQDTRKLLLSNKTNPYFYGCGKETDGCGFLGGIGSEDASGNAGLGRVWGLSLCTRLLTVAGDSETCVRLASSRRLRMRARFVLPHAILPWHYYAIAGAHIIAACMCVCGV
eukprot:COSAG06_NODE_407_length_16111_cov_3.252748_15_plen_192_part_00